MKTIAFTSGKGGVGKSNIAINSAITLAKRGARVCVLDADTGLANINILIGLAPQYTLEHLLSGEKTLSDITLAGPSGVDIIPGASGVATCVELASDQQRELLLLLEGLESKYDYLLIDTGAGISATVLHFVGSSQMPIVVITPEPTSLTDAFSLLKVLHKSNFKRRVQVLVNMSPNISKANEIYKRFETAVDKYIGLRVGFIGAISLDQSIAAGVFKQSPVTLGNPSLSPCQDFNVVVDNVEKAYKAGLVKPVRFDHYWQRQVGKAERKKEEPGFTASQSTTASSLQNKLLPSSPERVVNADRSSVTVEPIKPSVSADLAQDILSETATNALIESVWGSASGQLRQIIQMGKVTQEQVDILSRDLTILAMGLTGNKPGVNESKTTSFVKNMHAEPPFVIQKSALLDEPIKKQHQYDEATFGCQQRLIRSLRKAKAEDSTQVIQFLESIKHQ
jgi:MinD-like ATPase involved in chromosome partitioning or flagellar assembly